jgi:uncharacterized protein with PQ loop repeat
LANAKRTSAMAHGFRLLRDTIRFKPGMEESLIRNVADAVQLTTIALTIIGYVPQLRRIYKNKDSSSLSRTTWTIWVIGSVMALFYALVHFWYDRCCLALVITTATNALLSATTLAAILIYDPKAPRAASIEP